MPRRPWKDPMGGFSMNAPPGIRCRPLLFSLTTQRHCAKVNPPCFRQGAALGRRTEALCVGAAIEKTSHRKGETTGRIEH